MRVLLIKLFIKLAAWLPWSINNWLGQFIGQCLFLIPNQSKRITDINLRRCFPELPTKARDGLVRKSLIETAKMATAAGPIWSWKQDRVLSLIKQVSGEDACIQARDAGRPIIFILPHLGDWELVNMYLSAHYSLTCLYRPPRLKGLGDFIKSARERFGATLVPTDVTGIRQLLKALKRGETVCILPDQEPAKGNGEFIPFFGIAAYTMVLAARLIKKVDAEVVFVFAERLAKGQGYHLHFEQPVVIDHAADITEISQQINAGVEYCIRQTPEQYQWEYKRFRARPNQGERFY